MKFGQYFQQRSVPEWWTHNIDYDNVKELIKLHTTTSTDSTEPVAIPSARATETSERAFDDEIYLELRNQHETANSFVHVKAGEIERRLAKVRRRVSSIVANANPAQRKATSRRQYAKTEALEREIHNIGDDIRKIKQFTDANVKAFEKLLKKHRKWTNLKTLEFRFRNSVVFNPCSLFGRNFEPLFLEYLTSLEALRETKFHLAGSLEKTLEQAEVFTTSVKSQNAWPAAILHEASQRCSREIDEAIANVPVAKNGRQGTYWVHDDNLLGVQILLLRFALPQKLRKTRSNNSPKMPDSRASGSISQPSSAGLAANCLELIDRDRTTSSESAVFRLTDHDLDQPQAARDWLATRNGFDPVAVLEYHRNRSLGLLNSSNGGLWVSLDSNIRMRPSPREHLLDGQASLEFERDGIHFPHSVLQVRQEGVYSDHLVRVLDESHLVEKIPNFSIESYATYKMQHGPPPAWIQHLERDIRKLPKAVPEPKSRKFGNKTRKTDADLDPSAQSSTLTEESASVFSGANKESSATSVPEMMSNQAGSASTTSLKKHRWQKAHLKSKWKSRDALGSHAIDDTEHNRYWNEYDDAIEDDDEYRYILYTNTDASVAESLSLSLGELYRGALNKARGVAERLTAVFHLRGSSRIERQPLFSHDAIETYTDQSEGDNSTQHLARGYGTLPVKGVRRTASPARNLFRFFSLTSLFIAFGFDIGAVLLYLKDREGPMPQIDVVVQIQVVVLVLISFICAAVGTAFMVAESPSVSLVHRAIVFCSDMLVFIVGLVALVMISSTPAEEQRGK